MLSHGGKRATIIGGSIGSLIAARLLLIDGWDVHVFESSTEDISSRGGGIATHIELEHILGRLRMNMDGVFGLDVLQRRMLDTHGRIVEMQSQPQTFISWSRIYRGLRDLLPNERFHRGSSFVHCELLRDSVNAIFADGSVITSDILVGADGAHSAVRRQIGRAHV